MGVARDLPWQSVADRGALRSAVIEDAARGIDAILTAYVSTLPRVLTFVACGGSTDGAPS